MQDCSYVPASQPEALARPDRGVFSLSQLLEFTRLGIEPYANSGSSQEIILNLSLVRVWDIASLLWLAVALHHYRHNAGLSFVLRLPQATDGMSDKDRRDFDMSADFLRRWKFDCALRKIVDVVDDILVPEQKGYFASGPRRFYLDKTTTDNRGLLQSLISRRLVEIQDLADTELPGPKAITPDSISRFVARFQAERIGDILCAQCGIEKRTGDLFSDHLLTEALMNVQEHPNATIGMVGISVLGNSKELVLCVVDNGDPIPETIAARYDRDHESVAEECSSERRIAHELKARIIDYATQPGVTSKVGELGQKAGMGLTYIKQDTLDAFHGKMRIVTDSVCLRYSNGSGAKPRSEDWPHSWRGNLLRIAIPLGRDAGKKPSTSAPAENAGVPDV
jgi:hypothetical protein